MVDFLALITVAQRLISENGRAISLLGFNETPADVNRPYEGPSDTTDTPSNQLDLNAVFVLPGQAGLGLGLDSVVQDLLKRSEQVAMVSPGATADLKIYQQITDGSDQWTINEVHELKPGNELVLGFLGVRQ